MFGFFRTKKKPDKLLDSGLWPLSFADLRIVVVFDIETTGLSPVEDRIVSIAALKFDVAEFAERGKVQADSYSAIIDPEVPIPSAASRIHGFTDSDVRGQGNFAAHAEGLSAFIGSHPIVAHNINFDASFLMNSFANFSAVLAPYDNARFCTMAEMAKLLGRTSGRVSLVDACSTFEIPLDRTGTHDAMADATATMQLCATLHKLSKEST